ncbi:MAG: DUF6701 domain-containing protein [Gallionella sp.]
MSKKWGWMVLGLLGLLASNSALAVACTSTKTGNWGTAGTWDCNKVPASIDTVVLAAPFTVTLNNNYTTAGLTIDSGAVLNDNGNDLTVKGNVINNGTVGVAGGGGNLFMQTAGSTLSGNGTFSELALNIDAIGVSLQAGSIMTLTNQAQVRVGNNNTATFFLNGTINGAALAVGNRALRVYRNSSMTINGAINAPNAYIRIEKNTTVTNNGSVIVQYLDSNGTNTSANWTQGANAALTLSITANNKWKGTLNAAATGNTVTYNSPATPFPTVNTYYNLAGTGVTCPHTYTVLGTQPCVTPPGVGTVTKSPGSCVNTAGIGTVAWVPTPTTNVNLSDNLYATATMRGTSNFLKCTGYGFAIPPTATILGVVVNVERKSSATSRSSDGAMRLVKADVIGTIDRSKTTAYTMVDVVEGHGGLADLWGAVWTPADINAATFGAAFAAKTTRTRTISVDEISIAVTYSTPVVALHHIQIEHTGAGKTCAPEQLTVRACQDAACTANFTTANVTGNVTWAGSPGGTLPFSIASGGTGQTTLSLSTSAQTVTLGTSAISPIPTAASGCTNAAGGAACSLPFVNSTSCWDAVEVGAAATTPIFTKLAGTAFSLDVLNASNYNSALTVELVNATAGACAALPQLSTQNVTFSNQKVKTVLFAYANASANTKVRITAGTAVSCSTDAFVIRPTGFTVAASVNADPAGVDVAATPVLAAGGNFALTTSAVAGYSGTPIVDIAQIIEHTGAVAGGTVVGVFNAANAATGSAVGSAFTYTEVGYFKLGVNGVYDKTFANLDALEVVPECTLDYSNVLVGGKYGCYIGNLAPTAYFGRFIPHHFMVTPADLDDRADVCSGGVLVSDSVTPCASPFTYMGEQMDVNFTLVAANASNNPTQNYTGTFAKLNPLATNATLVWGAVDGTTPTNMTSRLDTSIVASNGTGSFVSGTADISVPIAITRGAADGPYIALDVGIAPVDSDGVTTVFDMDINNDTVMDRTQVNATSTEVRYGRSRISNAYGSELSPLSLPVMVEYWNGQHYLTNADDSLTVLPVTLGNYQGNLVAGETLLTAPVITNGQGAIGLSAPGFGNAGSVDVTITPPSYLPLVASGRATFGVYGNKNNFVYRGRRGR